MIEAKAKKFFGLTLVSVVCLSMFLGLGKVMMKNYYMAKLYYKKKCKKSVTKADSTKD